MKSLNVLILAAGEGTRMKSALPKVLHSAAGKSLLEHVLDAAAPLQGAVGVVLGRGSDQVKARLAGRPGLNFFIQKERRGSGDAVKSAAAWMRRRGGDVVVLCGDAPLVEPGTLRALVARHRREKNAATLLTAQVPDPTGYGRIRRGLDGQPRAIVEHRDLAPGEETNREINSGMYCFRVPDLLEGLSRLRPDNAKGEYYLTDVIGFLVSRGRRVGAQVLDRAEEVLGVNNRRELAEAGRLLNRRTLNRLMDAGVTVVDPATTWVESTVRVGADTVIEPFTFLMGQTVVGRDCRVGAGSRLENCRLADGARVTACVASDATLGANAQVGPFARLRGGAVVGPEARVGNFVEVKNAQLARGVKAGHLAYLGDAQVGAEVNIGAGVITCNYDGVHKHPTAIGAGAFIGSNANLVAPVRVGAGAWVGAGSTVTRDVPGDALFVERAAPVLRRGWAKQRREKRGRSK